MHANSIKHLKCLEISMHLVMSLQLISQNLLKQVSLPAHHKTVHLVLVFVFARICARYCADFSPSFIARRN